VVKSSRIMVQGERGVRPLGFGLASAVSPLLNSTETGWAGVTFELHEACSNREPQAQAPVAGEAHLRVVVSGSYQILVKTPSGERCHRAVPGTITFHSGAGPRPAEVQGTAHTLVLRLTERWLRQVMPKGDPVQGIHTIGEEDSTARELARSMCREVERGAPTGSLFAQSLSLSLLSYALDRVPVKMQAENGLSEAECRRLRRHIDERLGSELRLNELAEFCGLGARHFTTVFRRAFGTTPHRYVMQRRLERGATLLCHSSFDIAEIALQAGFSSQSHFTTAFRKSFGITPRRYALQQRRRPAQAG